ncbi:hypothetical protein [Agathobacter rectalis]|uniref:hypothetical protein n=1 Tax=Agathobacter rectalis TaxID=39491 RepID=UPI0027D21B7A|nr:hypothetical protein [Agathobacter rectalis]MCB7110556.1 hypothetical protein [Agathobacter rectalis]MCG4813813.1 hypothetical protein [Agathobacter rectalis]
MAENRVKYAYLDYSDISTRIKNGEIDQYDVVFTKDTHEQYLIKDDLSLLNIKSRIYCFDSIISAKEKLNSNTDTYEGQIVAIADNDSGVYHGYIVNKSNDEYIITSLTDNGNKIDYDSLVHRPIINKTGSLANPLTIGELDNGLYSVSGEYRIFLEYPTIFSSSINHLFVVEKENDKIYVKDVQAKKTVIYVLSNGQVSIEDVITSNYLTENQYITETDFDAKIKALDFVTRNEISDYVKQITTEYLEQNLDSKIDEKINSLIADDSEIDNLFSIINDD